MTHEQLQDAHIAALREIVEQRAEIDRLTHELTQTNEACAALREGKPLGPIIGAQTILNQAKEIERLKAQLAKGEVVWTTERPTTPGWYWWSEEPGLMNGLICWVSTDGWALFIAFPPRRVQDMPGKWAGPIPEPKEPA